ncbi:6-phosphofructokinase [Raineyella antarctica]|uniref:6-phosphofructokinase n=1 Tax=Raineyella antarctica TaxID=1577474 RepID=A0A1G6GRV2_9ACTN|nr:6-phosphofructokinase [Raineyella antarctica]SDB84465.1 6-phosphofructokinase [Raineyella antarctica]
MPETAGPPRIGVLTSGGDAPGMNPAVRAVVRSALQAGAEVFAIREGWQGAVEGGDDIVALDWDDVSGIMHRGGTVIGTARCQEFRDRGGRRRAALNLVRHGIDRLAVIGGDGSLTGADLLRQEWPELLAELVAAGEIDEDMARAHRNLMIAGLVGSIDNDMVGTDMTIGTDSALHRIIDAVDAISSTAASHQRTFIVEVMGRECGYLALTGAVAGGAAYTFIPEAPPADGWQQHMCELIQRGREAGRRDSVIIVAEGARDRSGRPITSADVRQALKDNLGQDARITILGHVQRGGTPSAYDRWMSSLLGVSATEDLLAADSTSVPSVLGIHRNAVIRTPLIEAVQQTRAIASMVAAHDFEGAVAARGVGFSRMVATFNALAEAEPRVSPAEAGKRIGIIHAGGLAPGMNTAVWAAVRLGIDAGHRMLGIQGGFPGFVKGHVLEFDWGDVEGWTALGGAELGTRRTVPAPEELYGIARTIEDSRLDGLLVIGGLNAYEAVQLMYEERRRYSAFDIPIVALPASIDNNLPDWKMAIGADTALNVAVESLDRLKQSAAASRRCFVVETMGRTCGFLAMLSGLAAGAERVYTHEEGITVSMLEEDVRQMTAAFEQGRRFYLAVRSEEAAQYYTTDFLARLFEAEGGDLFDVRALILGHVQQGGNPTAFDRLVATRLAASGIEELDRQFAAGVSEHVFAAESDDEGYLMKSFKEFNDLIDFEARRPKDQWWLALREVARKVNTRSFADQPLGTAPGELAAAQARGEKAGQRRVRGKFVG